jgi:hypothetical protein
MKLLAAALLSVAVAGLLERRGPIVAVAGSVAGLVMVSGILVFPDTLVAIFPTGHTFVEMGRAVHQVSEQARVQVAPTVPLRPLLFASLTAVWAAAFAAHALAVRSGSPLLAALPPASLLAFADITLGDGPHPQWAGLFLLGALAVLFMDGLRRVRQWGPLLAWSGVTRRRIASTTATRGARRLTVAALAAALLIPGVLPGYQHPGILRIDAGSTIPSPVIDPLVSVTASLHRQNPVDLFLVRANQPAYWRWMSLDQWNGSTWTNHDLGVQHGAIVPAGDLLPQSADEETTQGAVLHLDQTVVITHPPGPWLPMAFHPVNVSVGKSSIRFDPNTSAAVPLVGIQPGLEYRVTSTVAEPTRAQLERIPESTFRQSSYAADEALPSSTPGAIRAIAERWSAGQTTPFGRILAIEQHLLRFRYDQNVSGAYDVRTLVHFLTVTKRGFCQQFASAMAVLVRSLGYPARVATGFTPGVYNRQQQAWRVSTNNAHTWVEVLFPGYGWVDFDPTPGSTDPEATYLGQVGRCAFSGCGKGSTPHKSTVAGQAVRNSQKEQFLEFNQTRPKPSRPGGGATRVRASWSSWLLPIVALLAALALALFLVVFPVVKTISRRARVARARRPVDLVLAEFHSFSARATDLGLARRPGETLRDYRDRLRGRIGFSDGHVDRLTEITARAAYAADPVSEQDAKAAVAASRRAMRDMRRGTPFGRRVVGLFRPGL